MSTDVELVLDARAMLGEGPLWDMDGQRLYWVDILRHTVHRFDPATSATDSVDVGELVGAAALSDRRSLVLALERGFAELDWDSRRITRLAEPVGEPTGTRFNDGKCDPKGRFWAGTMALDGDTPVGSLYRLERHGAVHHLLGDVTVSNGLAWSSDGRTMFYIDTPTRVVQAFDFDLEHGTIGNRRTAFAIPEADGIPDGMTSDADGMLWIAHWGGAQVTRWNPLTGHRISALALPVTQVTSCCFGGRMLDELYITSARTGLSDADLRSQPLAGGVFRAKPGVRGTPMYAYRA